MNKAELELRIAALSPEKRAFFEKALRERRKSPQTFDVSPSQQGMWFLEQLMPGSPVYSVPFSCPLIGPLIVEALQQGLQQVIERHASLRSRYLAVEGHPVQVVEPERRVELPLIDLEGVPQDQQLALAQQLAQQEARRPFCLHTGPLLRVCLLRLHAQHHLLLLNIHHLVFDSWSLGVLLRDWQRGYEAALSGEQELQAPLPLSYADYALWQREQRERNREGLAYWRERLAGAAAALALPTDRPRAAVPSAQGAVLSAPLLGEPWREKLEAVAREQRATKFMVLLAVWVVQLWRASGQSEVVVGTPLAGRSRREVEGLIGLLVNTLPLRVRVGGQQRFRDVLKEVKEVALGAYGHQEVPLDQVVEELGVGRSVSAHPLFQVVFVAEEEEAGEQERRWAGGLQVGPMQEEETGTAKFDLTWSVKGIGSKKGGLGVNVEYSTQMFERERIEGMIEQYRRLLEAALLAPDTLLCDLPMLTDFERQMILEEWNATATTYPQSQSPGLYHLIEEQVLRTPEAIALRFQEAQLTYRELNIRANRLAHQLQNLGVGVDTLVGICMERSLEMVIGLLGILKAGGAYVPLDPEYPQERLAFMLQDSQVSLLLTQSHIQSRLPEHETRTLCLDGGWSAFAEVSEENPAHMKQGTQETLAYMIYTSGSTGKPKGAMNTHRGICNRLLWMQETYQLQVDDRVLQKTPFSFDVSVWEFFWPLICGASVVLARPGGHREGSYLLEVIAREQITTLHFVPSMLSVFLETPQVERCQGVARVICSGEALSVELQKRFFERLGTMGTGSPELHNLYGPTEAAVDVTYWACRRDDKCTSVPIGRPIANIQIYLLDKYLQPVPVGVPGALYIGGVGLARGYFGRPELTAERFIPHLWGRQPGERLYYTGDLACYRSDGTIEYLGRLDNQVKLRGFRIELGEIEATLKGCAGISEAVVTIREDHPGEKRLVAYVTGSSDFSPLSLRSQLREHLPEYMVPSTFVLLESLPLSPNGKLDLKALPPPGDASSGQTLTGRAPQTEIEKAVAEVWRGLLHRQYIDVYDNFFDIGGDSLLLVRVQSQLQQVLGYQVTVLDLFKNPTIHSLAQFLSIGQDMQNVYADVLRDAEAARLRAESARLRRQHRSERLMSHT